MESSLLSRTELAQKAHVVGVEVADVVYRVHQHRHPFHPEPEGVPAVFFRVEADVFEHIGVNHSAAHYLYPPVAQPADVGAHEVHLKARLGEREKARAQARLGGFAEQVFEEVVEYRLQIGELYAPVHAEAFYLVEIRGVRGVDGVAAERAARGHYPDWRALFHHRAYLHARSVAAQEVELVRVL